MGRVSGNGRGCEGDLSLIAQEPQLHLPFPHCFSLQPGPPTPRLSCVNCHHTFPNHSSLQAAEWRRWQLRIEKGRGETNTGK